MHPQIVRPSTGTALCSSSSTTWPSLITLGNSSYVKCVFWIFEISDAHFNRLPCRKDILQNHATFKKDLWHFASKHSLYISPDGQSINLEGGGYKETYWILKQNYLLLAVLLSGGGGTHAPHGPSGSKVPGNMWFSEFRRSTVICYTTMRYYEIRWIRR